MIRLARKIKHYADIDEDINQGEVLPEKTLEEKLTLWELRLEVAKDPSYVDTCRGMIKQYKDRLDRLGVRTPCEN